MGWSDSGCEDARGKTVESRRRGETFNTRDLAVCDFGGRRLFLGAVVSALCCVCCVFIFFCRVGARPKTYNRAPGPRGGRCYSAVVVGKER